MKIMKRPRRLRKNLEIRQMVQETHLHKSDLIFPIFVVEGTGIKKEILSLPDQYHYSVDMLDEEMTSLENLGINSVLLFGIPSEKNSIGSEAYNDEGIVQRAIRAIKEKHPNMYVITDVCMCQYTSHGHCGILNDEGYVINDKTIEYIAKIALSHVKAGADMVAPSDMMDGRIGAIRQLLDLNNYGEIPIMSYSAKYSSAFYGPFRTAAGSTPGFGDRKTYQMDFHNSMEALREMTLDIEEGADIIMVKPAMSYLDVIRESKNNFNIPIAAYNVSGEYSMIKNAIHQGILDQSVIYETIISMKRAGADIIITYFAKEIAAIL